jgi:uncharacterized membrane protein YdjX (TVP38/TMEM64 family)
MLETSTVTTDVPAQIQADLRPPRSVGIINGGVFLLALLIGVGIYFTPVKSWLAQGQLIKDELALFGLGAPVVFVLGSAVLTAVGVPRLLVCSLGGMIFGFAWGLLWTQIGSLLGCYATFLFIRWRGPGYTLQHFPRLRRFSQTVGQRGILSVLVIRQLPMNGFYNTVFLGLTPVSHSHFLVGSLLGFLPLGVTSCLLGAGLIQQDIVKGVQYGVLAFMCSVLLAYLLRLAIKRKS